MHAPENSHVSVVRYILKYWPWCKWVVIADVRCPHQRPVAAEAVSKRGRTTVPAPLGRIMTRRLAVKYLTVLRELNAGELISIAVLIAVGAGVVYGVLS